ncbi:PQQ-like beta-propeller repeat protein [bacterium]|nr:PQQ-like beta-propeller repeat protein [bacterium]
MRASQRVLSTTMFFAVIASAYAEATKDWTEFRGQGGGSKATADLPDDWSADKNIAWTSELPGRGLSGPIVVGDKVIITASSGPRGDRLHVLAMDARSGKEIWHRQFWATGNVSCHPKMCNATPTPATDGEHVVAFYSSNDMACLDLDGNLVWYRGLTHDYPLASNSLGMSSSPVVVGGVAVASVENEGESFLCGIDIKTGKNLWKAERPRAVQWASPVALRGKTSSEDLVLTQGSDGAVVRRPKTGEVIWKYDQKAGVVASATVAGDTVFIPSDGLVAAKLDYAQPEATVLWQSTRVRAGTPSPIIDQDRIYTINSAILQCSDAKTGEPIWKLRLKGSFSSTPVLAGSRLYAFNEDGIGFVVDVTAPEGKILSENKTGSSKENPDSGETILGSPAIAQDALFVRSDSHLWKIAKTP